MNVSSIHGEITLDASGYKKGIDEAAKATRQLGDLLGDAKARFAAFGSEEARATIDCIAHTEAEKKLANQLQKSAETLRLEAAFARDLSTAHARLTAIREGESAIAQKVISQYAQMTVEEQKELTAAREAIATHEAQEKALAKLGAEAERLPQRLRMIGRAMTQVGREMTQTLTLPILAAGAGILKAGVDVDKGMDAIQIATGATGQRLKALQADFKAVGSTVPNSLADVGKAVGEVATRTGLTGPPLEALTRRLLTMQRLMGGDLAQSLEQTTRLFGDWGVKVGQQSRVLDLLGRAHEQTGINLGKLTRELVMFGAPLRTVGFSLEQSVALFGKWNREGVNAEQVATSIRIAVSRMVKAGVQDIPGAFQAAIKAIQAAKSPADALALSFKLFGARAGTDMARAIREGRFAIDDLARSLVAGGGTILDTAKKTDDFGERFAVLRNKVELALQPLGSRLMDALDNLGKSLTANVPRLTALIDGFLKLPVPVQRAAEATLLIVAGAGPALVAIGKLISAWGAVRLMMQSAAAQAVLTQAAVAGPWIAAAIAAIGALAYAWNTDLGGMKTAVVELGREISEWWNGTVKPILTAFGEGAASIGHNFVLRFNAMRDAVNDLTGALMRSAAGRKAIEAVRSAGQAQQGALGGVSGFGMLFNRLGQNAAERTQREQFRGLADYQDVPPGAFAPRPRPPAPPVPRPAYTGVSPFADPLKKARAPKLTAEQKEGIRFAEELAQAQARLSSVLAGEDNIAAQVAARYHLLSAARRADLVSVLERIRKAEDEKKAHLEVVQAIDSARLALLKSRAAAGAGEFSRQAVALDVFKKKWADLSKEQQGATDKILKWKIEQKGIDQGKEQVDNLKKSLADLQLEYEGLTAATEIQRFVATDLHRHWGTLTEDEKILAAQTLQMKLNIRDVNAAHKASVTLVKQQAEAFDNLGQLLDQATAKNMELKGATDAQVDAFKLLAMQLDLTDPAVLDLVQAYLTMVDANEQLEASTKAAAAAAREKEKIDNLLANTMADLSAEYDQLTGKEPEQTRAINRLIRSHRVLTVEQQKQLAQIRQMFRQRELMRSVREFADGMEGIFENAFEGLSRGFKGFFQGIYQGFRQLLMKMAAEYLASQLKQVVLKGLTALISAATGGGGGGGGGAVPSGGGWGGGFAMGGSVQGGRPIMVGEEGAELFVPRSSGMIVPHNQLAGAGGHTFNVTVNVQGEHLPAARQNASAMAQKIGRELSRQQRRNGSG